MSMNKKRAFLTSGENLCVISFLLARMEKISDDYFVVGTQTGRLYFIKYRNKQFIITEEMDFLNDEIRKISFPENEDGKKDSLITVANK